MRGYEHHVVVVKAIPLIVIFSALDFVKSVTIIRPINSIAECKILMAKIAICTHKGGEVI